ncbi:hypothetical protein EO763_23155 (plasmid) [Pectobacterium odoriferum]|nr:hypothetical protein EO763_23155 [Pectobacterium odoriferum]
MIINLPSCPSCGRDNMFHRLSNPDPTSETFILNGWYCDDCQAGPYQLGHFSEADAARFALTLLNHPKS